MTDNIKKVKEKFAAAENIAPVDGLTPPDDLPTADVGQDAPPPRTPFEEAELAPQGAKFPLNDTGNGQRFALYYGDDVMMVPRVGWYLWDGKRWAEDPDKIAIRGKAQLVQSRIIDEIPHLTLEDWQLKEIEAEPFVRAQKAALDGIDRGDMTPDQVIEFEDLTQKLIWIRKLKDRRSGMKSDHRAYAKTSGNGGRIDNMLVESTVQLAREVDDLDSDPLTVNTESGLLRFSVTGGPGEGFSRVADVVIEDHARESTVTGSNKPQYITKMVPVEYDADAKCPLFDDFLERIQPNREMRAFLQRWFGLSMTGLTGEQKFAFLYGDGANGKSVLVDLVGRLFGDYSATAKIESLTGTSRRGGGDATPDLIPLIAARMVRASEPEEGERLKEGMIKEFTGGEPILVRKLHGDFIEVKPGFKLTISGNHKPDIRGTDDGIWRRVLLVPFDVKIPEAERNEKLASELFDQERAGILNWLVKGLLDYLEGGLQEPQQVLDATLGYRSESDPIGSFLKECCIVTGQPTDFTPARDLMDGFNLWLDQKGEGMWGSRTVSLKMKHNAGRYRDSVTGKVYTPAKQRVTGYRGIRFQDLFQKDFDNAPRNAAGHPVAATAKSAGGSGYGGSFD